MSVLKGEGKVPILFGSTSIAVGSRTLGGYLARPDLGGEWPTIVVVSGDEGVSANVKNISRRLARQGFSVVGVGAVYKDLVDLVSFVKNPAGFWSSAEYGVGVLAIDDGTAGAVHLATTVDADALAIAYGLVDDDSIDLIAGYPGPMLGVWGSDGEANDVDLVRSIRDRNERAELVLYGGIGHAFLDDSSDDFDTATAQDAIDRLAEFFGKHLPPPPA